MKKGIVPGSAQRSPIPFIITEDGIPHFKRGGSLSLTQERKYFFWFFCEPREILARDMNREWTGKSRREENILIKDIATRRRDLIDKSGSDP
jgi:hypothetical protein